jgi:hypothetical protein
MQVDADKWSLEAAVQIIRAWISGNDVKVLNVAGPRASEDPRIYSTARSLIRSVVLLGGGGPRG